MVALKKGTLRAITDLFKKRKDVCAKILMIDKPGEDPDSYIKKFGIEAFRKLPRVDYLEWMILTQIDDTYNDIQFAKLIDEIINYTESPVLYSRYAKALADKWKLEKSNVDDEIKMAHEKSMQTTNLEIDKLVKDMLVNLEYAMVMRLFPSLRSPLMLLRQKELVDQLTSVRF